MNTHFDAIVIGAGAAGLMCALTAGQRGLRVLVLDHANKVGKKILMSGGGRCNFTNTGASPANFLSANKHFCKSALARYTPWHFIELVERHGHHVQRVQHDRHALDFEQRVHAGAHGGRVGRQHRRPHQRHDHAPPVRVELRGLNLHDEGDRVAQGALVAMDVKLGHQRAPRQSVECSSAKEPTLACTAFQSAMQASTARWRSRRAPCCAAT